ncbi:MAG: peptide-methionine (S)-S-oxide reductase MsrA [Candidatus Krumholzibacteriia bacterium]
MSLLLRVLQNSLIVGGIVTFGAAPRLSAAGEGPAERAVATFAGGCFWCMQPPYDKLEGVISTTVGYTGGHKKDPTYRQVSSGGTGHAEAIQIVFDPEEITYEELLTVFWRNIDPTTPNRQFCDWGGQYRPEVFYHDDTQKRLAEQSKAAIERTKSFKEPIRTKITPATEFYPAEDYHQGYYRKYPRQYKSYRKGCGRDRRLEELWGKKK